MKINSLYAVNFRNYESCSLQLSSMINVFYGQNAQGKTNLLEAIFYRRRGNAENGGRRYGRRRGIRQLQRQP